MMTDMSSRFSLRNRLIAAAAAWVTLGFVVGYFFLSAIFAAHVDKQFHNELKVHVDELRRLTVADTNGELRLTSQFSDPRYDELDSGYYWQVRINERMVLDSPSLSGRRLVIPPDDLATSTMPHRHQVSGPTGTLLILENVVPTGVDTVRRFIVGMDARHLNMQVAEFNRMLALALLAFGATMIGASYVLVKVGMAPFSRLANGLRHVRQGKTATLEGEYPTEVAPLVAELNALIEHSRETLARARSQAGNLAHGLKTPLAIISDEAFQLEKLGDASAAHTIIEQCRGMQAQIDQHIARARASALARLPGVHSDIGKVAEDVINALSLLHREKEITTHVRIAQRLTGAIDTQDLSEILGNVIDNAFKHARKDIRISAETVSDDQIKLIIEDDGPGLAPEAREYVFQSGARLDETLPGSGLGLSIVQELIELYGGRCQFDESDLGGARLTIHLPRSTL